MLNYITQRPNFVRIVNNEEDKSLINRAGTFGKLSKADSGH